MLAGDPPAARRDAMKNLPRGQGQKVMVVHDKRSPVRGLADVLERLGYAADAFTHPVEALLAFERAPNSFDLILAKFSMPQMTGADFAVLVRSTRPKLPVILHPGKRERIDYAESQRLGVWLALDSPTRAEGLARTLRIALFEQRL
jgi:CheY-like chemotaxis protein